MSEDWEEQDAYEGRNIEIKQIGETPNASYRVRFLLNGKSVGSKDFDADGTKEGDISAQDAASNAGRLWKEAGQRDSG